MGGGGGGGGMMGGGGGGNPPPSPSNTSLFGALNMTNRIGEIRSMGANIILGGRNFEAPDSILVKVGSRNIIIQKVGAI